MAFQRQANRVCFLVFAWGSSATSAEERCRVAGGGGSCNDPSSRALLSETTASMLQMKASSQAEDFVEKVLPRESNIEDAAAALEEGVETQMGTAAQDAISGLEKIGDDIVKTEKQFEETGPEQIDQLAAEATETVGEQIEETKVEGLKAIQGASNTAVQEIDAVADSVESKLSAAELELKSSKKQIDGVLTDGIHEVDGAIDTTVELLKQTVEHVAPNENLKNDFSQRLDEAVRPYVAIAKQSLEAQKDEVNTVLSEISRETGNLGEEFQGIAGQVAQETKSGVNAAVTHVAS